MLDTMAVPSAFPVVETMFWDRDYLWVQPRAPVDANEWHVFDTTGAWIARVLVPRQVDLVAAREGRAWGFLRSVSDDVELVGFQVDLTVTLNR
jgi:hypothetical protein